jgi:hypothetical protein
VGGVAPTISYVPAQLTPLAPQAQNFLQRRQHGAHRKERAAYSL